MRPAVMGLLVGVACTASASAETYWLAYEGNDFPENEGWTRMWNLPWAQRWIEDGALVIDASTDRHTCEWYEYYTDRLSWPCPAVEWPEPGSHFFVQWRLKIEDFIGGWSATSVGVFAADSWAVAFLISDDTIRSAFEPGVSAPFEPGVFHEFEMRSPDMRAYALYIDGLSAIQGSFQHVVTSNTIVWGEDTTGASSLSRWDYLRVGIAPEPASAITMIVFIAGAVIVHRRSQ